MKNRFFFFPRQIFVISVGAKFSAISTTQAVGSRNKDNHILLVFLQGSEGFPGAPGFPGTVGFPGPKGKKLLSNFHAFFTEYPAAESG